MGDFIGSVFEGRDFKSYNLDEKKLFNRHSRVTDDSVLLAATAEALLDDSDDFGCYYRRWAQRFPNANYGPCFSLWLNGDSQEHMGFSNGAAVRASVIGYMDDEQDVLDLARKSAVVSHRHPEGINGALAMAWTCWAVRNNISADEICQELYRRYDYYIKYDMADLHHNYTFDCSAINSVPVAIFVALKVAHNYENAMRLCMHIGGDTDSIMAMSGIIKSQECAISVAWQKAVKTWLWCNAQPILDVNERFESRFTLFPTLPF